jgi:hypothetical protein
MAPTPRERKKTLDNYIWTHQLSQQRAVDGEIVIFLCRIPLRMGPGIAIWNAACTIYLVGWWRRWRHRSPGGPWSHSPDIALVPGPGRPWSRSPGGVEMQRYDVQCSAVQCSAVQCSAVQRDMTRSADPLPVCRRHQKCIGESHESRLQFLEWMEKFQIRMTMHLGCIFLVQHPACSFLVPTDRVSAL